MADAVFTELLISTCTIRRNTPGAQDAGTGQPAESWANLATNVACRMESGAGAMNPKGFEVYVDKQFVVANFVFFFDNAQDITEKDEITAVDGGADTYEIVLVTSPGGVGHHKEVFANRIKV